MGATLLTLILAGAGAVVSLPTPEAPQEDPRPIRSLEVLGSTLYDREAVWRILRLRSGSPLKSGPEALARILESHYRIRGFPAARVRAGFDVQTETLRVEIDEGRLASVEVAGLSASDAPRAVAALDLEEGTTVTDSDITDALRRLDEAFRGAFETVGAPPYDIAWSDAGARLTLRLRKKAAAFGVGRGGTGRASLFNRVEGFQPGLRARLLLFERAANPLEAYAHASYGFAAGKARLALGARSSIGHRPSVAFGYEYHDLTDTDDTFRGWGIEKPPGRMVFFSVFEDYFSRRGHEASVFLLLSPRFHFGLNWRNDRHGSLPIEGDGSFFFEKTPRPNPPVSEGVVRSVLATVRWSTGGPLFDEAATLSESFLVRNPYGTPFERSQGFRGEATFEVADREALGGDFSFRRFVLHLRGSRRVSSRQSVTGRILMGLGGRELPTQKRFALGGFGTLRGHRLKELTGDNMAMATGEYAFEPGSPYPGFVLFYDGGTVWSHGEEGPGWRSDLGMGILWPGGGARLLRIDVAVPLNGDDGRRRPRVTGSLLIPAL